MPNCVGAQGGFRTQTLLVAVCQQNQKQHAPPPPPPPRSSPRRAAPLVQVSQANSHRQVAQEELCSALDGDAVAARDKDAHGDEGVNALLCVLLVDTIEELQQPRAHVRGDGPHHAKVIVDQPPAALRVHGNVARVRV